MVPAFLLIALALLGSGITPCGVYVSKEATGFRLYDVFIKNQLDISLPDYLHCLMYIQVMGGIIT